MVNFYINEIIFILHTLLLTGCVLLALRFGQEALITLICLYAILSNVFVLKQITLFGLDVTASDAFAVGAMFGLNLVQEYYGATMATKTIKISFFCLVIYTLLTQFHLFYLPNAFDTSHVHFAALYAFLPRITLASCISYLTVQYCDRWFYQWLQQRFAHYFLLRNYASLILCQFIDTVLFSFLGLYGVVGNIGHIILVSYLIKLITIAIAMPLLGFVRSTIVKKQAQETKE